MSAQTKTTNQIKKLNALCAGYGREPVWKTDADGGQYACISFKFSIVQLRERPAGYRDPLETFYAAAKRIKGTIVGQMYSSNGLIKSGIVTVKL